MVSHAKESGVAPAGAGESLDDAVVVQHVLAGDQGAFELLMRRYNQRLYRIVRGILGNDAETEDALQESYLNAYRNLGQFRGEAKFSTWLGRIAVHEALHRRRDARHMTAFDETIHSPDPCDPRTKSASMRDRPLERGELRNVLTESIDDLPDNLRSVVMLRDVEGLSTGETAECLSISEGNVRILLHRAREMLQTRIDERIGSEVRMCYQFGAERCDRVVATVLQRLRLTPPPGAGA